MNQVILMGRLTKEPELRRTQNQTAVCSFTIAVDRDFSKNETDFIDCVAWKSTGEFVAKYFGKGSPIAVSGRLQIRDWTDKDRNKRRSYEVVVENAYFCESKKERQTDQVDDIGADEYDDIDDLGDLPF